MTVNRLAIYERDQGKCGFCGDPVPIGEFEADHVPPRGFGLPHELLRVSHRLCNRRAGWNVRRELNPTVQLDGYALRIPPDLKEWLEARAKENRRSLNSEMVFRLEQSVAAERT